MFHPILADKLCGNGFKLVCKVVFRLYSEPLFQSRRHLRFMLRAKLPQERVTGIFPQAGVGNIKHIPKPGFFTGIVHKGNALGAAPHIPAHGVIPEVIFRTGRCVRALGEDHKLLMEGVLIQPGCGGKKGRPFLPAICHMGGGIAGHRAVILKFRCHWCSSFLPVSGQRKSRKPFLISCRVVPPVGGWYSLLKVRVSVAR